MGRVQGSVTAFKFLNQLDEVDSKLLFKRCSNRETKVHGKRYIGHKEVLVLCKGGGWLL